MRRFVIAIVSAMLVLAPIARQAAAAPADHLTITTVVADMPAGTLFNVQVVARDGSGAIDTGFNGTISINAAATGGSNFPGGTLDVAATGGVATIAGLTLGNAADDYVLTATSTGVTDGQSNSFDVTASQLVITSEVTDMQAGTPFAVTVEARDADDVTAENFNGDLAASAAAPIGGANFNGGSQATIASGGSALFDGLALNDAADGYTIDVSSAGLVGATSGSFNVTATHLAASPVTNVRAGDGFGVTVQARDANDNVAENFSDSISLGASATGGSNLASGTAHSAAAAGTVTFGNLVLNNAADGYVLTASSPGYDDVVSNSFNVTARQLVIVDELTNTQAGAPFAVTVEARDADNVTAENFAAAVAIDAAAVGGTNFTGGTQTAIAIGGATTFTSLVLDAAANGYTVTASSSGVGSAVSNSFDVTPGRPDISIDDVTVVEGNWGTRRATFTVTLSQPVTGVVTVGFTTAGATATSGTDFVPGSGTVTFAPGVTSQTISIAVKGDRNNETDETFVVNLSGAVNGKTVLGQGVGTIRNDDPLPVISAQSEFAVEGSAQPHTARLTVRLSAPSGQQVRVSFQTVDGTARDGVGESSSDYTATTGTLVFAPGQTQQTITVALRNDLTVEPDEYFFVELRTPANAVVATPRTAAWILDDDAPARQLVQLGRQVWSLDLDRFRTADLLQDLRLDCGHLRQFTRDIARYRGTHISRADADALTSDANRLLGDLRCR